MHEAHDEDVEKLLQLMREFNESQGYDFDWCQTERNLQLFIGSPSLGRIWLLSTEGAVVGYLVLTCGFSFEYGGRDAFIDELFVEPRARGRGLAKAAVTFVLGESVRIGVCAVHLEVERSNSVAKNLYESLGFASNDRQLLTHRTPANKPMQSDDPESRPSHAAPTSMLRPSGSA